MGRHTGFIAGVLGAWLCSGLSPSAIVSAETAAPMRQAAGEIVWLDTQLGQLQLNTDTSVGTGTTAQYKITQQDTRVTDRSDKQFLTITDLRAGQHVNIESTVRGEDRIATKITVEPTSAPFIGVAEGTLESIDASNPGTFTLKETAGTQSVGTVSAFVFDPNNIIVREGSNSQSVRLEVNPGDFFRVEYVMNDGTRYARSMTRYPAAPVRTSTTTTTTRTTSQ